MVWRLDKIKRGFDVSILKPFYKNWAGKLGWELKQENKEYQCEKKKPD